MRVWLAVAFFLLFTPLVLSLCSEQQTQQYLAHNTDYVYQEKQVDYIIVIDRSGSMEGAKLQKVKEAAKSLIAKLPASDRAAIISFNNDARLDMSLTGNKQALYRSIEDLNAEFSTRYTPPLALAARELNASTRYKAFIFLSDGKSDFPEAPEAILSLTESIAEQNACIMTISYAVGDEESPLLEAMAEVGEQYGCGEHFAASEQGTELEAVFTHIYTKISSIDLIKITPAFVDRRYSFTFSSKLNNYSVPGVRSNMCAEDPDFTLALYQNGKHAETLTTANGRINLPPGEYTYRATASLTCGGTCNMLSSIGGTITIGATDGVCEPNYYEVATYVTGETQAVDITPAGFVPRTVSGRQGTVVVWTNKEAVTRRLTSAYFNRTLAPGETYTYIIENVGTLIYSDPDRNLSGSIKPLLGTGTDVAVIIDESGSMKGSGLAEAKDSAYNFFSLLSPADRGALITFSHQGTVEQYFTSDKSSLQAAALKLRAEGATNYLSALRLVPSLRPVQQGVLVFMSDGIPTDTEGEQAILDSVEELREQGWCVMTVGFGEEGKAARSLLSRMAGTDECSTFLYASSGKLAEAFGTIYQLSHEQQDLVFIRTNVPPITFRTKVPVRVVLETKTGKPFPAVDACTPWPVVQVRSGSQTLTLEPGTIYKGDLFLAPGAHDVQLVASLSSPDQPTRAFVGVQEESVIVLPLWTLVALLAVGGMLIYALRFRRA